MLFRSRLRKLFGGGMRQAGYLAAAGLYAMEHHVERLAVDHAKAAQAVQLLARCDWIDSVLPVETNLLIFRLLPTVSAEALLAHLSSHGIRAATMGPDLVRFVFHLDLPEDAIERIAAAVRSFSPA